MNEVATTEKPNGYGWEPQGIRHWYTAMADWLLANPDGSMAQCARDLGRSPQAVRMVAKSQMFKAYYAKRRQEIEDRLADAVVQKNLKVADKSLDLMLEKLETGGEAIPISTLTEISGRAIDRLYASKAPPAPEAGATNVNVVVAPVPQEVIDAARTNMRQLQAQKAGSQTAPTSVPSRESALELEVLPPNEE